MVWVKSIFPCLTPVGSGDESMDSELLDALQTELETMLSSVARRMKQLAEELDTVNGDARSPAPKPESKGKDFRGKVTSLSSCNLYLYILSQCFKK